MIRFLKNIALIALLGMVIIFCSAIAQFSQFVHSNSDLRGAELQRWAGNDNERLMQVELFIKACLVGGPVEQSIEVVQKELISIEECGVANDLEKVSQVVNQADKMLKSYAWPFSLVAS